MLNRFVFFLPSSPLVEVEVREVVRLRGASEFLGDRLSWLRETLRDPGCTEELLPLRLPHGRRRPF